jgi:hypothetical protein
MELVFAGLHQLCGLMLSGADSLPEPQRDALRTAFALAEGPPPDRFLLGLAVLSLLSAEARHRPLVCLIDDQQWLDRASAQVLGLVARRLRAEPIGLVFAVREPGIDLASLPELEVGGLPEDDARVLLDSALTAPLDARVRDLIVAESHGNPLALRGDFAGVEALMAEARAISETTQGNLVVLYSDSFAAALRGDQAEVMGLAGAAVARAEGLGQGVILTYAHWATAILHNGRAVTPTRWRRPSRPPGTTTGRFPTGRGPS